jgi:hypothetical protein
LYSCIISVNDDFNMGMTILGGVILIPDYKDRIVSHGVSSFFSSLHNWTIRTPSLLTKIVCIYMVSKQADT